MDVGLEGISGDSLSGDSRLAFWFETGMAGEGSGGGSGNSSSGEVVE